jgi:anhydro-N-acetylmuramic acid kinase
MSSATRSTPLLFNYPVHRPRLVVGLISGTSADGIDAAAVRLPAVGQTARMEVLEFRSLPYPGPIREQVMLAAADKLSLRQTAVLGTELGHLFAEAALSVVPTGVTCDLIASHGQTVCHLPEQATTLQIGDAAVIACRTGVVTVSDFRTADMACGGQGAPLVPMFDAHLLAHPDVLRVAVNLGGIANITVIEPDAASGRTQVLAWDTGPANCVSDALCRLSGQGDFDPDGRLAKTGQVLQDLLAKLLAHPYFAKQGPKSTGLEDFGEDYARTLMGQAALPDLLRTSLALSAQSLADDLLRVARDGRDIELVFAGGGTANAVLMEEIRQRVKARAVGQVAFRSFADFGVPEEGREAAAFAFLGDRTARGLPGAAISATGASRAAVLGKVSFPS